MPTRTFVATGYAHHTVLVHEYGCAAGPLDVHASLEAYDAAYPPADRDEYDAPVRVTLTYDLDIRDDDGDADELERIIAELTVDHDALTALLGD